MSSSLLQRLRHEFDSSFERAVESPPEALDLFFLTVAGQNFALKIRDLRGLAKLDKLVTLPSRANALAGIAGLRGEVVAVFDLGKILPLPASRRELQWMVTVAAQEQTLGLGFDALAGYGRVAKDAIHVASGQSLLAGTVSWQDEQVALIDVEAVVRKICMEAET